jgi:hypothetical protein
MTEPLPLITDTDNADAFLTQAGACPGNDRMLIITITRRESDYLMHVIGSDEQGRKRRPVSCSLPVDPKEISSWRQTLHLNWEEEVVKFQIPGGRRGVWHPTSDLLDLRAVPDQSKIDDMWRNLARAGQVLFSLLFGNGDDRLNAVGERLAAEVRAQRLTITVHSDELVVPWALLYTPPEPDQPIPRYGPVDLRGFWGIRHIIEHTFTEGTDADAIPVTGRVQAGGYTDTRIDEDKPRTVRPVMRFLDHRTDLREGTTRDELREHFGDSERDDHLLYFCCHCEEDHLGDPLLRLSDDKAIAAGDIKSWIGRRSLRRNPLVFINACNAAFLPSSTGTHIGSVLLSKGASGLVGPNVSVPQRFAMTYATALLRRMLRDGQQIGPAMRDLAEHYAERRRNPLGLAYSAYQNMDTHFCRHPAEGSPNGHRG